MEHARFLVNTRACRTPLPRRSPTTLSVRAWCVRTKRPTSIEVCSWADLPGLIERAATGEVKPFAEYYVQRTAWVGERGGSAGYHFSVLCAEDIAPLTDEDVARATAGTFMGAHLIDGYRTVCNLWPYARLPASHWTPIRSDIPTLLLSGGRDPVTPPEGGEAVAAHLSHALHVIVPGGGHGVGGPCIDRLILALIETASVERLDPSCVPASGSR